MIRRFMLVALSCLWVACAFTQDDLDEPVELSIKLPEEALVVQPQKTLTFIVNSNSDVDGLSEASYWYALNGQVLEVSNGRVVYLSPSLADETFDVLVWHNTKTGQFAAVALTLICEEDVVPLEPEKIDSEAVPVFRVPLSSNAGIQLFVPQQGGDGYSVCLTGRPLNPPPSRCRGSSFRESRDKRFHRCGPWRLVKILIIDAQVIARARRHGVDLIRLGFRIGARVRIEHRDCITTHMRLQDCYECQNDVPVYVGSRVIIWRKRWTEVNPNWGHIFAPPPPPQHEPPVCVSSGNCPCP